MKMFRPIRKVTSNPTPIVFGAASLCAAAKPTIPSMIQIAKNLCAANAMNATKN